MRGDICSARCKACDIVLPAHHAGLTEHSQNPQHLQQLFSLNLNSETSMQNDSLSAMNVESDAACVKGIVCSCCYNTNTMTFVFE